MSTVQIPIPSQSIQLIGDLTVTSPVQGVGVIAVGRSRHGARDRTIASSLHTVGWGTLLLGLLTPADNGLDGEGQPPTDELLCQRLVDAVDWLAKVPTASGLPIALIGTAADSGPVLAAAAARPKPVDAVVLISGHASPSAPVEQVRAPVLLICVSHDEAALAACCQIADRLRAPHKVQEISAPDRLFTAPDASEQVGRTSAAWLRHPASAGP
jgi:hypothetical protein